MVLLKNDNNTLPIKPAVTRWRSLGATVPYVTDDGGQTRRHVNFATDVRTGDLGSSRVFRDPAKSVGPFAGIHAPACKPDGVNGASTRNARAAGRRATPTSSSWSPA